MKNRNNFLKGIYGFDALSMGFVLIALLLNFITLVYPTGICQYAGLIGLLFVFLVIFRTFSHNISARWAENQRFLQLMHREEKEKDDEADEAVPKEMFRFFKCPACHLKIRVPKGKGRIEITCPKCTAKFIKKT